MVDASDQCGACAAIAAGAGCGAVALSLMRGAGMGSWSSAGAPWRSLSLVRWLACWSTCSWPEYSGERTALPGAGEIGSSLSASLIAGAVLTPLMLVRVARPSVRISFGWLACLWSWQFPCFTSAGAALLFDHAHVATARASSARRRISSGWSALASYWPFPRAGLLLAAWRTVA